MYRHVVVAEPVRIVKLLCLVLRFIQPHVAPSQEQAVAISFAFEPTEASVMQRPPRKLGRDTLVDSKSVLYSYGVAGTLEALTCIFAFFIIFQFHGIPGNRVLETYNTYWQEGSVDLVVGGTVFTAAQQVAIASEARAAYYATLIGCQFSNIWNCKTQITSIFVHPIFKNRVTFVGVAVMAIATTVIIYVPAINTFFGTAPLVGWGWTIWIVFAIFITLYNELSKRHVRKHPQGAWARHVQW